MAGFLYHRPDARTITAKQAAAIGLGYAIRDKVAHVEHNANSPSGKAGIVFADVSRQGKKTLGYFKDQQTWRKLPNVEGRPELWVGYWNDAKPTPDDLRRPDALRAIGSYTLGENCRWDIPTLTELDGEGRGECALPGPEDFDDDGNIVSRPPVGEDSDLWDIVHPLALALCGLPVDREPTHADYRAGAIALLKRNYVVDVPELAQLGALFSDSRYQNVVMLSCRGQWLLEEIRRATSEGDEKKTESEPAASGSATSAGAAA